MSFFISDSQHAHYKNLEAELATTRRQLETAEATVDSMAAALDAANESDARGRMLIEVLTTAAGHVDFATLALTKLVRYWADETHCARRDLAAAVESACSPSADELDT